jgi:hypothetical protein
MAYRIAGIDVHKKMLAVVVSDVEVEGEYQFERRMVGTSPDQLRLLAEWLHDQDVEEVVITGDPYGKRWSGTGSRFARSGRGPVRCRARCIWHRPNRIAGQEGGRRISLTPNAW